MLIQKIKNFCSAGAEAWSKSEIEHSIETESGEREVAQRSDTKKSINVYNYDPALIGRLKAEHGSLLTIFGEIQDASDEMNDDLVKTKLTNFKLLFTTHLIKENYIYGYLKKNLDQIIPGQRERRTALETVKRFENEMKETGLMIRQFLDQYTDPERRGALVTVDFDNDLGKIGSALKSKLVSEEAELYVLYKKP